MATLKKIIVFSSIMFLATALMIGCDREEQAVMDQSEEREQLAVQDEEQDQGETAEMERREEATSAEIRGETEESAYEQSQQEAGEQTQTPGQMAEETREGYGLIGKSVMSNDGQELGEVAELEATGRHTGYVFVKGDDEKLHPIPANLLEEDAQGEGLRASFERSAFEGSPSFSESELENISDSQLEEVRGYYEENSNQ